MIALVRDVEDWIAQYPPYSWHLPSALEDTIELTILAAVLFAIVYGVGRVVRRIRR